jgi:hypothetical protein
MLESMIYTMPSCVQGTSEKTLEWDVARVACTSSYHRALIVGSQILTRANSSTSAFQDGRNFGP